MQCNTAFVVFFFAHQFAHKKRARIKIQPRLIQYPMKNQG